MKRIIAIVIVLALGMAVLTGCKNTPESENPSSNKDINNTEEFSGRFSGASRFYGVYCKGRGGDKLF